MQDAKPSAFALCEFLSHGESWEIHLYSCEPLQPGVYAARVTRTAGGIECGHEIYIDRATPFTIGRAIDKAIEALHKSVNTEA